MKCIETTLPGVLILEPKVHGDDRGWFYEGYNAVRFAQAGIDVTMKQFNLSRSSRGVLRGLHYQWPHPQGKLVSVLEGEVFDVAVDIRRGSPTFGQSVSAILSASNRRQMWIPEGFAHGFATLSDDVLFCYHCTEVYDHEADAGIRWGDAALAIDWPISTPALSGKDAKLPYLADVAPNRLPTYPS
jgi:dTDP-4-dehydrorhamnose 3,5-epimerase